MMQNDVLFFVHIAISYLGAVFLQNVVITFYILEFELSKCHPIYLSIIQRGTSQSLLAWNLYQGLSAVMLYTDLTNNVTLTFHGPNSKLNK